MPLIHKYPSEVQCPNCLHWWDIDLDSGGEQDSIKLACPVCKESYTQDTEEIEVEYNDYYL